MSQTATSLGQTTGIVLAGGRSTRFGRDKLAEPYRGEPLLHHTLRRLAEVCDELVVVLAPGAPEPVLPEGVAGRFARDPVEGAGPLAGALAGLLGSRSELALLAGGDMPELVPAVLGAMLDVARSDPGARAVALGEGDMFRPLPSVMRVEPAADLAGTLLQTGRRRLRELLAGLDVQVLGESAWRSLDPDGRSLLDIDEPGDLPG